MVVMNSAFTSIVALGVSIAVGVPMGAGLYDFGESIVSPETSLVLEYVYYKDGMFHQKLTPKGVETIRGEWTAQISRGDRILCNGGSVAPYQGKSKVMTPDQWTGSRCPDMLLPTDTAFASWDYTDEQGIKITISKEFQLGE